MEKQHVHVEERKATVVGSIGEPEVAYVCRSSRPRTRKGMPQPEGINQSMEEAAAAWRRQIDEFIAEGNRIYETGDTAALKDLARRMEAFMRKENTMERRLERIDWSLEQIRRGEYMTAEEADEAVRRALPWLR